MASPPTNSTITVFLDSSVLITACISEKGAGRELIELALRGTVNAFISDDVLEETERNLTVKAPQAITRLTDYRSRLSSNIVNPQQDLVQRVAKDVEAKDAPIVAAAIEAHALYLATYDQKHLLTRREHIWNTFNVMTLTPLEVIYLLPIGENTDNT